MKKFVLTGFADYNFTLIGICSHEDDFKLCWHLNNALGLDFRKVKDVEILHPQTKNQVSFPMFFFLDTENEYPEEILNAEKEAPSEEDDIFYHLISNRNPSGNLVPEQKKTDYFLRISGESELIDSTSILQTIREMPVVLTAFILNPAELKSRANLIF